MSDQLLAQMLASINALRADLTDHIHEEDSELRDLKKKAEERAKVADERHLEILNAIQTINIVEALPKDNNGKPDIVGHRNEHEGHRRRTDWIMDFFLGILKDGGKYAFGAFSLWALYHLWQAFLMGPKP